MSGKKLFTRRRVVIPILWVFIGSIVAVWMVQINRYEAIQIAALQNNVIKNAISRFEYIVAVRQWSAGFGGVYVKPHTGLKPNPYLKDNVLHSDQNETLVRINPAWMTRQISEISNQTHPEKFKITSLRPINPHNAPDSFEVEALRYLEKNRKQPYHYHFDGSGRFRFVGALYVEKGCLNCHGEQGYSIGDVRGGISINLPLDEYRHSLGHIQSNASLLRWVVGLASVIIAVVTTLLINSMLRYQRYLAQHNESLENAVQQRTRELKELNLTLEERVKREVAAKREQEEVMIRQSRHAAMGEMIAMIAHQWRQPVATVSMIANRMIMDVGLGEMDAVSFGRDAEDILSQAVYLSKTIDDFSNFFKTDKTRERFYPSAIIEEAFNIIHKSFEDNHISISFRNHGEDEISGYPHELLQVYLNLFKNAKEAVATSEAPSITVTLEVVGKSVITTVLDNGTGIEDSIIDSIFTPYFTTKEELNGTGLGLYMSKIIIENHFFGTIGFDRFEGQTRFIVSLPSAKDITS